MSTTNSKQRQADNVIQQSIDQAAKDIPWPLEAEDPVPLDKFGKDHWSTFAYLESRIVNYQGKINHKHMRCDENRHPIFASAGSVKPFSASWGDNNKKYPSLIKGELVDGKWTVGNKENHDDYDCLTDLIREGFLEAVMPSVSDTKAAQYDKQPLITGLVELQMATKAKFKLTEKGHKAANALRKWKSEGNSFHSFCFQNNCLEEDK
jgi:hypothetical protein